MANAAEKMNSVSIFSSVEDKLDTGRLYHRAGDLPQAEELYRQVLQEDPYHPEGYHLLGLIALQSGKAEVAKEFILTAISLQGNNPQHQANLGAAYFNLQEFEEAIAAYSQAIELDPDYADAHLNQGVILKELERYEEAVEPLDKAVNLKQDDPKAFALLAEVLVRLDRHDEAEEIARAAMKLGPSDLMNLQALTKALGALGRPQEAIAIARKLVAKAPTDPESHLRLAGACMEAGLWQEAVENARRAIRLDPARAEVYKVLSQALMSRGEWDQALQTTDQGLALVPDHEELIALKASILERKGHLKEAFDLIQPLIKGKERFKLSAVNIFTTIAQRYGEEKEAVKYLELACSKPGLPQSARCSLNFQLGGMYHALGEYNAAFQAYRAGNKFKPRKYHPQNTEELFARVQETFSRQFFGQVPSSGLNTCRPIFIVGMPRSGTSLLEQILASHSQVFGAGELMTIGNIRSELPGKIGSQDVYPECVQDITHQFLQASAEEYLARLNDLAGTSSSRVTDKMPQNFLHLGMMALMFPQASFIHIRRDPLDTCLSCYFQNFAAQGLTFAYDLEDLAHYYKLYAQLMEHWQQVLPVQMLEVQYEDIVDQPHKEITRILKHCHLQWEDACLDFHTNKRDTKTASYAQVRQPIYTSSKRKWKKYEKHLGPLKQALA